MRAAIAYFAVALILFAVGAGLWTTGRLEQRMINARQQFLTLDYKAPVPEYDRIEASTRFLTRAPWVAERLARIRSLRAGAAYWQGDYARLTLERDAGGALTEQDPAVLQLAANAAFRTASGIGNDPASAQQLDDVLGVYAEALRHDPQFDVAFNYEFVARTRDRLTRQSPAREKPDTRPKRAKYTIHGRQGAPPEQSDMREFKVIVPQRSDERSQQPDAGSGGKKQRKG